MDKIKKKLRSKKGESLIESLVSILIFTLASIMLYTMLSTSVRLNQAAKDADAKHEQEMMYAEQGKGESAEGKVIIKLANGENDLDEEDDLAEYEVNIYRQDKDSLYSYSKKVKG